MTTTPRNGITTWATTSWLVVLTASLSFAGCSDDPSDGGGGAGGADTASTGTAGMAPMPPNCSTCGEIFTEGADTFTLCGLQSILTNGEGTLNCVDGTSCSLLREVQKCLQPGECGHEAGAPACDDQTCIDCITAACPMEVAACEQDMI